jgi:hypothetical protein
MIRQVAASSDADPLDFSMVQSVTRPSGPMVNLKPVVPSCRCRMASGG